MAKQNQKNYQRLRSENLKVAKALYKHLKTNRTLTPQQLHSIFCEVRGENPRWINHPNNWETIKQFLKDHGLMTWHTINGFTLYVATQKCVRTKNFENATIEYQHTSYEKIGKAMDYQKLNDGALEPLLEGKIIAEKILGLEENLIFKYAKEYARDFENHMKYGDPDFIRYAVVVPTHILKEIKVD